MLIFVAPPSDLSGITGSTSKHRRGPRPRFCYGNVAMEPNTAHSAAVPLPDGRQSETALAIARGTGRLVRSLGFCCVSELPLPSGRRADRKWQDYRAHCDRLFFAFTRDLACGIFPGDTGLIVADAYGAHLQCEAPEHRLPAPTRKAMMLRFAMAAAQRLNRLVDPQGQAEDI
jgi:hypothetical protein